MLLDSLQSDVSLSLKKGDRVRVETLRFLIAAIRNYAIATYGNKADTSLSEADIARVIASQVKTHKESIEAFNKAGRSDLVEKEKAQLVILESFLPKQIADDELKNILAPVVATGETNFGLLMKNAMAAVKGKADGGRVATVLKNMISK